MAMAWQWDAGCRSAYVICAHSTFIRYVGPLSAHSDILVARRVTLEHKTNLISRVWRGMEVVVVGNEQRTSTNQ